MKIRVSLNNSVQRLTVREGSKAHVVLSTFDLSSDTHEIRLNGEIVDPDDDLIDGAMYVISLKLTVTLVVEDASGIDHQYQVHGADPWASLADIVWLAAQQKDADDLIAEVQQDLDKWSAYIKGIPQLQALCKPKYGDTVRLIHMKYIHVRMPDGDTDLNSHYYAPHLKLMGVLCYFIDARYHNKYTVEVGSGDWSNCKEVNQYYSEVEMYDGDYIDIKHK